VYTAKMAYAVDCMINNGEFAEGARVLLIHSGGLQGRRGYPQLL
jgi:1-aminocyclopropane-1-carboxylate deaminase/D-cysteine desulfhydrase-like pyridoxal-dependent ACC family enzyme